MADLTYHVVDVFTDRAYAGNPLAVVLDADDLSPAQCQAMAREFNLSETSFVMRSAVATYRLRIFTPAAELPFAGHPSIGTAWLLGSLGRVERGDVTMECAAGVLPVVVGVDRVSLTAATPNAGEPLDAAPLLAALSLNASDAGGAPPRVCSTGIPGAFIEVSSPDAVRRVRQVADVPGVETVSVFAWDAATRTAHTRVFAGNGIGEDPATGSAAASFGAWLVASGYVPDGETAYVVTQGAEMGRPSRIEGTVVARDGVAVECGIAGSAVPVATGTISAP